MTHVAWASLGFEDAVFPELATSGRALAMGNAFISRVDDSLAAFYNPAGLGTIRYQHLHISNLHLESNNGFLNSGTSGTAAAVPTDFIKSFTIDGTRQLLLEHIGTLSNARFQVMPNFTTRYFTAGYLVSKIQRAYMGNYNSGEQYEYASRLDYGPYVGMNLSLFGGVLKFGGSAIYLARNEAVSTASATTTLDIKDGDYKKGTAVIITGGAKLTLPIIALPSFSATLHNVAATKFSPRAAGAPTQIAQTLDGGFSLTPQIGVTSRVHFEVNYKDIMQKYKNVSVARKILLGMEFDFSRVMFVRFGYGDGFGSAGLGIKSKHLEFDLTTYAVDTTTSAFRGREDRRFAMTLSSGF